MTGEKGSDFRSFVHVSIHDEEQGHIILIKLSVFCTTILNYKSLREITRCGMFVEETDGILNDRWIVVA